MFTPQLFLDGFRKTWTMLLFLSLLLLQQTTASAALVSHLKLDDSGGTTAADSSGSGNSLALYGSGFYFTGTSGVRGNALTFNGSSYYMKQSYFSSIGTNDFTFAAWIKTTSTNYGGIFMLYDNAMTRVARLGLWNNGKLTYGICAGVVWKSSWGDYGPTVNDGNWHHVAVTFSRNDANGNNYATLYVDGFGIESSCVDISGSGYQDANLSSGPLQIGRDSWLINPYFDGMIDDVRVYNHALSGDEIWDLVALAHWNLNEEAGASTLADATGNGFIAKPWNSSYGARTLVAGDTTTEAMPTSLPDGSTKSIAEILDGSGNWISGNSKMIDVGNSDISFSAWFKTANSDTDGSIIAVTTDGGGGACRFRCMIDNNGNIKSGLCYYNGAWNWLTTTETNLAVNDNQWHHVAVTCYRSGSDDKLKLYIDGIKRKELDINAASNAPIDGYQQIGYDSWTTPAAYFNGTIDEVYVFDRLLTDAEVDSLASIPAVKKQLIGSTDSRGAVVRPTDFIQSKPGAAWVSGGITKMNFDPSNCAYRARFDLFYNGAVPGDFYAYGKWCTNIDMSLKNNREYILSALIKTDFPRPYNEVNMILTYLNNPRWKVNSEILRSFGLPSKTTGIGGWERWEHTFTADFWQTGYLATFCMENYLLVPDIGAPPYDVRIADICLIEKPAKALTTAFNGTAAGVSFIGSPGNIPMAIVAPVTESNKIRVITTGARYTFDLSNSTIQAEQRLERQRQIATYTLPAGTLSNLTRYSSVADPAKVILYNTKVNIGVQADSMMIIAPRAGYSSSPYFPISVTTQVDSPSYTRFEKETGILFACDEYGGVSVHPDLGLGTGYTPVWSANPTLDFLSIDKQDYQTLSTATPGWGMQWTIKSGQRLCLSVFPGKEYDWNTSFSDFVEVTNAKEPLSRYTDPLYFGYSDQTKVTTWLIFDFLQNSFGMSYGTDYLSFVDNNEMVAHVNAINSAGDKALPYVSAFFYLTRDAQQWVDAVAALKNSYGINGFYCDGIPAVEFLTGYEQMRGGRALFPDGELYLHDGDHFVMPAPFTWAYMTRVLMQEMEPNSYGPNNNWARYVCRQFRCSNSIGDVKYDHWTGFDDMNNDSSTKNEKAASLLLWNGRHSYYYVYDNFYGAILDALKNEWLLNNNGSKQYFYDQYYLPKALQKVYYYRGIVAGRTGMPTVTRTINGSNDTITLSHNMPPCGAAPNHIGTYIYETTVSTDIHYTTDGTEPTTSSNSYSVPFSVTHKTKIKAKSFSTTNQTNAKLDPSRTLISQGLVLALEAEVFTPTDCVCGGGQVYNINNGDYIQITNQTFANPVDRVEVDVKSLTKFAGDIEVWINEVYKGSIAVPDTSKFSSVWWTVSAPISEESSVGSKTIKLVFRAPISPNDYAFVLDKVRFYASGN